MLVGDATHDVRAAAQAGIATVGLLTGGYGKAELEEAGARAVFATPAELLKHLAELEALAG